MLNHDHFMQIAGRPKKWDDEVFARAHRGESLVNIQRDQFDRGRRSVKLLNLISGWAVVDATGLGDKPVLFKGGKTKAAAIRWGRDWAEKDPDNREFFASKMDMQN